MGILIALLIGFLTVAAVVLYASRYPEPNIPDDLREAEIHARRRL